ncbi:helix-turn-helix domain-containing protein [Prevotella sp. HUN102]|uniref:Helix-turn-helix domain-containing protein n=3 Tax=unclassified Prevotella TaxID=2638335 RepID=A0AB33JIH5_9BACT|nr:helix-turn-helix domain-containing protein [Prevotella sp. HUN102]
MIQMETVQKMFLQIMGRFDNVDRTLERMNKVKDCLDGDTLLENHDLCRLLGVTKRTLARYRQKKLIRYYMIDGRTYYKASEIGDFLKSKGKELPVKKGE